MANWAVTASDLDCDTEYVVGPFPTSDAAYHWAQHDAISRYATEGGVTLEEQPNEWIVANQLYEGEEEVDNPAIYEWRIVQMIDPGIDVIHTDPTTGWKGADG